MNSDMVLDFDQPKVRDVAAKYIRALRGPHKFVVTKCRPTRTLNQNSYYFGVVLPDVASGMSECYGETVTADEAHEHCRKEFNSRSIVNRKTGEIGPSIPRSTADLDVAEFSEYLEKIFRWAGEYLQITIRPADKQFTGKERNQYAKHP